MKIKITGTRKEITKMFKQLTNQFENEQEVETTTSAAIGFDPYSGEEGAVSDPEET